MEPPTIPGKAGVASQSGARAKRRNARVDDGFRPKSRSMVSRNSRRAAVVLGLQVSTLDLSEPAVSALALGACSSRVSCQNGGKRRRVVVVGVSIVVDVVFGDGIALLRSAAGCSVVFLVTNVMTRVSILLASSFSCGWLSPLVARSLLSRSLWLCLCRYNASVARKKMPPTSSGREYRRIPQTRARVAVLRCGLKRRVVASDRSRRWLVGWRAKGAGSSLFGVARRWCGFRLGWALRVGTD